jgi:hypothetical protein
MQSGQTLGQGFANFEKMVQISGAVILAQFTRAIFVHWLVVVFEFGVIDVDDFIKISSKIFIFDF